MNDAERDRRLAVSLDGEDLERWNFHVVQLRESELFLGAAININKAFVMVASPFSQIFQAIGVPLRLLGFLTAGLVHFLFRLLLTPFFAVVLSTSSIWATSPRARPALILVAPIFVMVTLWMLAFFPEDPDIRDAKINLCKLWPLSRRRLEWIKTHRVY